MRTGFSQEVRKIQLDETNNYKVTVNNMVPEISFVKGTTTSFKVLVHNNWP
jgi:hypothetical protein